MIKRGVSSDSFTMNAETDLGPLVSLELNSLFASSLCAVSSLLTISYQAGHVCTSRFHLKVAGSRIVRQGYGGTRPLAPTDVRNMSSFARSTSGLLE